jgi:hypothetical protein
MGSSPFLEDLTFKSRDNLQDINVDGRIILKTCIKENCCVRRYRRRTCTWLGIGHIGLFVYLFVSVSSVMHLPGPYTSGRSLTSRGNSSCAECSSLLRNA